VIPTIRAEGTHAEAGAAVGLATAAAIRRRTDQVAQGRLQEAGPYRDATLEHLPWIVEELDAAADAAGVDRLALFAASVEELSSAPRGCTDVVADGIVAHTNDLDAADEDDVVAIEWAVAGEPRLFTLGIGPWLSVGWNEHGLSVTGNELSPNDERVGIPRLLLMREVVRQPTLEQAVVAALHPARASSYNWVLAAPDGAANVEGSATDAHVRRGPRLVHANHYAEPSMLRYEARPGYESSRRRHRRAEELLAAGASPREILCDHEAGICRHGDEEGTKTVFWCVADVRAGRIEYGRGAPCESTAQVYELVPTETVAA
jgi:acyl-CoA:6-aminopenicillanic acid acyl transferase